MSRMPAVEQRMDQLPNDRSRQRSAQRGNGEDAARAARVRRSALLLAALALFFYVAYIAWMFIRSNGGFTP
jgi:hypothetical protein